MTIIVGEGFSIQLIFIRTARTKAPTVRIISLRTY